MIDQTMEQVFRGGQERGVPIGTVNSPQDLANSPQLRFRGFFVEIDHPETGKIKYPAVPYHFSKTPWAVERPAPLLGQHNEDIYCQLLGYPKREMVSMRENGVI
jgi:crotonobetainyl-CoA:carnitine CoA-transferase CaiB-like acyl-CoA transferase